MDGRIFCVGMNYLQHVKELEHLVCNGEKVRRDVPSEPVIFMKPASAVVPVGQPIRPPFSGAVLDYETELVVRIGKTGRPASEKEALRMIDAVTLGVDLTLRSVQTRLRHAGHPWEAAKAFEGSAPLGAWVPFVAERLQALTFIGSLNGEVRQEGAVADMLFSVPALICFISRFWALRPGDAIFTGTPPGVGALAVNDTFEVSSPEIGNFSWIVADAAES